NSGKGLPLLELPAKLAAFGIRTLEICHFHLPSRDRGYLREVRGAMVDAGVEPFTLLIDAGDLTDPLQGERDLKWISEWLDDGAALGVERCRVIAGKAQATEATMAASIRSL